MRSSIFIFYKSPTHGFRPQNFQIQKKVLYNESFCFFRKWKDSVTVRYNNEHILNRISKFLFTNPSDRAICSYHILCDKSNQCFR